MHFFLHQTSWVASFSKKNVTIQASPGLFFPSSTDNEYFVSSFQMLAILSSLALSAQDSVFPKLNQLPIWLVWHPVLVFFLPQPSNFMYLTVSQMGFFFLRIFLRLVLISSPCYSITLSQLDVLFSSWIPQWLIWEVTAALLQTNIYLYRLYFSVTQPSPEMSTCCC